MKKERIVYIDYLKVIGLLLVILAHVDCPRYIMQIRSFDVPLLVVLSGYLASKTFKNGNNITYYWKRIQRLAVPSWIFLIAFFTIQSMTYSKPSLRDIFMALTFQRDATMVGMLWIIWVYLICALLIPIIYKIGYSVKNNIAIILAFCLYELVCITTNFSNYRIIYITLMTIIPWGVLTYLGFYLELITRKQRIAIIIISLFVFSVEALVLSSKVGAFVSTNDYKYPARLYYFSYAVPIILILMELFKKMSLKRNRIICFISGSSLWIYLWHILILYVVKSIITNDRLWFVQYTTIIMMSITITLIQNIIVKYLMHSYNIKCLKVFLG